MPPFEKPMISSLQDSHSASSPQAVALTGFMAAGKSTIGRELARLLRWNFIDMDCEIERESGLLIRDLFTRHGEDHFRKVEADALRMVLAQVTAPTVIALGGGTFVQPQNAALLRERGVRVVFLEHDLAKLLQRCRNAERALAAKSSSSGGRRNGFLCALCAAPAALPSGRRHRGSAREGSAAGCVGSTEGAWIQCGESRKVVQSSPQRHLERDIT